MLVSKGGNAHEAAKLEETANDTSRAWQNY